MRSTAVTRPASHPVRVLKLGICGWKPWPQSHTWFASNPKLGTMSRLASITARSFSAAGPAGHTTG